MKKKYIIFFLTVIIIGFFSVVRISEASGGYSIDYFTPDDMDSDLHSYPVASSSPEAVDATDRIILPKLAPEYLFPIYKKTIGQELSSSTKKLFAQYLSGLPIINTELEVKKAIKVWQLARRSVNNTDPKIGIYKNDDGWSYINCLPDSFLVAAKTLDDRKSIYSQSELETWVTRQDAVFAECGRYWEGLYEYDRGYPSVISLTAQAIGSSIWQGIKSFFAGIWNFIYELFHHRSSSEPVSSSKKLLLYDEVYQNAAKDFYAGDFESAVQKFQTIEKNSDQPWRMYAALAVGRSYLRESQSKYAWNINSLYYNEHDVRSDSYLKQAYDQFQNILNNPEFEPIHQSAQALINLIDLHQDPSKVFLSSDQILNTSDDSEKILRAIDDYRAGWDNNQTNGVKEAILAEGSDFSKWMYEWTKQNYDQSDLSLILLNYNKAKSLPWLLVALRAIPKDDLRVSGLLQDAANVPKSSAAFWTAQYYRIRLLIARGNNNAARSVIASLPSAPSVMVGDYIKDLKMRSADSLQDVFANSERQTAFIGAERGVYGPEAKWFVESNSIDRKAQYIFMRLLTLRRQLEIALPNNIFNPTFTKDVKLTVLTRALLLDDVMTAKTLASNIMNFTNDYPELNDFLNAQDKAHQDFSATVFLLNHSHLKTIISRISDKAWQDVEKQSAENAGSFAFCQSNYGFSHDFNLDFFDKFIIEDEIQQIGVENNILYSISSADYLAEKVISYANLYPTDVRIPKALHDVIVASRYSNCRGDNTTAESKKAFNLLHRNYPNDPWTIKTPYYY